MARGLFEIHPGRPNGYLEYQATQWDPMQQLSSSLRGTSFAEAFSDARRRAQEDGSLDENQDVFSRRFLDNRAKKQKTHSVL